jgi:hypothetical protein
MAETLKSAVAVLRMMEQTSAAIERSLQVAARAQSLRYVLRREPPITLAEPE